MIYLKRREEINEEKQRWRIYHNNMKDKLKSISIFSKGIRIS